MITIVNYGLGNVHAFAQAYRRMGISVNIAGDAAGLKGAERVILPGVGAFDWAMSLLNASGMRETLDELVVDKKCPVLGVCVGMQMLGKGSEEGNLPGLGWIDATVKLLPKRSGGVELPHMGWNDVTPRAASELFHGMEEGGSFYFLHSYYVVPRHERDSLAVAHYGQPFTAAVHVGNVWGTQFHPEKSHAHGSLLLRNFAGVR